MITPAIVFAFGIFEAFTMLPPGKRARSVVAAISILGLVLYVGGYVTALLGDYLQPGVDSWCSGPISMVGMIMLIIGFAGAVILLPVEILMIILAEEKKLD